MIVNVIVKQISQPRGRNMWGGRVKLAIEIIFFFYRPLFVGLHLCVLKYFNVVKASFNFQLHHQCSLSSYANLFCR